VSVNPHFYLMLARLPANGIIESMLFENPLDVKYTHLFSEFISKMSNARTSNVSALRNYREESSFTECIQTSQPL
jgi:hypothetical protein